MYIKLTVLPLRQYKMQTLGKCIEDQPRSRGLAIIVTNDYSGGNYRELKGTRIDGERLTEAFGVLNFVVCNKHNISSEDFYQLMTEARRLRYDSVKQYWCMVFVFSGHGKANSKLILQDEKEVDIWRQFIDPVLPGQAPQIGSILKIFIIDACRGDDKTETVLVPKGNSMESDYLSDPSSTRKGSHEIPALKCSREANFLVAYSTLPSCEANEDRKRGSLWLEILAEFLPTKDASIEDVSIEDVLTDANKELLTRSQGENSFPIQQPDRLSRLNDIVYLLRDKHCSGMYNYSYHVLIVKLYCPAAPTQVEVAEKFPRDVHKQRMTQSLTQQLKFSPNYEATQQSEGAHSTGNHECVLMQSMVTCACTFFVQVVPLLRHQLKCQVHINRF